MIYGFVVLWKVVLYIYIHSSNGMVLEFTSGVAKADPQCMYKVNPYYHGSCERTLMTRIVELLVLDLSHQSTGVVCALLDNASAIHVNDHRTIPSLGEPWRYITTMERLELLGRLLFCCCLRINWQCMWLCFSKYLFPMSYDEEFPIDLNFSPSISEHQDANNTCAATGFCLVGL